MTRSDPDSPAPRRVLRGWLVHGLRVALVATIGWMMHDQHQRELAARAHQPRREVTVGEVQRFFPAAKSLDRSSGEDGRRLVYNGANELLGYILQTAPASDAIVGFSGPTNCLLAFDVEHRVVGIEVLESRDTLEHVADVRRDPRFLSAFVGQSWDALANGELDVEGVSGATLTSVAIREGIATRLGGQPPGLRFPRSLELAEVREFFPDADRLAPRTGSPIWEVWQGRDRVGGVLRTSPISDRQIGYQGPTDTLVILDPADRIRELRMRDTFDNEPYARYVRDDEFFRGLYRGLTLGEVAARSTGSERVEGVSGATMTSQAMAAGVVEAARVATRPPPIAPRELRWRTRDYGTCAVVFLGVVTAATSLRGIRVWRVVWQCVLIGYLGFVNADLLSQAQLVGWARAGVPWRLAPGLVLLTAVSLLAPVVSKRQLYCQQLCPYGAVQQLVRLRVPWRLRFGPTMSRWLAVLPAILLVLVLGSAMWGWPIGLSHLEPFDAFVYWIAGGVTLGIAAGGVLLGLVSPLGYCRFGCPTGAVLAYLRRNSASDEVTGRDILAGFLWLFAVAAWYWK